MTEAEFLKLITTKRAPEVLKVLAAIPEANRRAFAPVALKTHKAHEKAYWERQFNSKKQPPEIAKDAESLGIAVLATARPSEYKCGDWQVLPRSLALPEVFRVLRLSWVDAWAEAAVEDNPRLIQTIHALFHEGLCRIPRNEAYILGYYAHQAAVPANARSQFLKQDVWRFFEVEGGGDLSLAAHDKYCGPGMSWADALIGLCQDGTLDRTRLLDASLDALERDFGQFRAGWYSRFHAGLCPTGPEMQDRVARYLDLLRSTIPPTVAFALKVLKQIDKTSGIDADALLSSLEPALQSRQKTSAVMALQLLKNCAKRNPERAAGIALLASSALISEAPDVQARALDLIEALDQQNAPEVQAKLTDYVDVTAPTVKTRLRSVLNTEPDVLTLQPDFLVAKLEVIEPVTSAEDAVAAFLELLENRHDPFLIECAFDGLARYGVKAQPLLSPLAKRASQMQKRALQETFNTGKTFEKPILATALAWANRTDFDTEMLTFQVPRYHGHVPLEIEQDSFEGMFAARAKELLGFVRNGLSVPMLSAPNDNRGFLAAAELLDRLDRYRNLGVQPGEADFKLALMRLAPEGRKSALERFRPQSEAERASAYALGADIAPESDRQLWAIAWSSTVPLRVDSAIERLVGGSVPGLGVPASYGFHADIKRIEPCVWPRPKLRVLPPIPKSVDAALGFALPAKFEHTYGAEQGASWMTHPNPWVGLIRPAHSELFFSTGIFELELDQKLTNHHCLMFLEPLFRPDPNPGVMAHAMLAWYLASADEGIGSTTIDAITTLVAQERFDPLVFSSAAHSLVFDAGIPLRRWTKRMAEVARTSDLHAQSIKTALGAMMIDLPTELPRDLGGILELLYELCVASSDGIGSASSLAALENVKAGGKTGKFARQIVAFQKNTS
ncbi:DUF6493 family protein [Ruegeria atlantica]|uniref:DUF6493 family protein n=1 Tax=Ruegeria atlantica TaxID=81569 RepID=UPI00147ECA8B